MRKRTPWTARRSVATVVLLGAGVAPAACTTAGDLDITNTSRDDVVVVVDGEEIDVTGDGGVLLMEHGCTEGDVTVRRASGEETVLPGPVCPPDRVFVGGTVVEVRPGRG